MVVVDNNILSSLAKIERLSLLPETFEAVYTIPSVIDELHRDKVAGYAFVERIDDVKSYEGGWLNVISLTENELELTETIVDSSLSFTDAECIAVSKSRDERLLTDDSHVNEVASQNEVEVWDLKLLLEAGLYHGRIETEAELAEIINALQEKDNYRFSSADREDLFNRIE